HGGAPWCLLGRRGVRGRRGSRRPGGECRIGGGQRRPPAPRRRSRTENGTGMCRASCARVVTSRRTVLIGASERRSSLIRPLPALRTRSRGEPVLPVESTLVWFMVECQSPSMVVYEMSVETFSPDRYALWAGVDTDRVRSSPPESLGPRAVVRRESMSTSRPVTHLGSP